MSLLAELKRRNVIRMAALYLVGAWLIVQVAGTVLPMFGAPAWLPRSIVVLLALGFVPALVFSWVFELTPEGLKRDAAVAPNNSIAPQTGRRMDRMIVAGLFAVIVLMGAERFWHRDASSPEERGSESLSGAVGDARPEDIRPESDSDPLSSPRPAKKSIAVLPFADLSPARDQEYFSDGIAEEILNALVRVKDLKVAGRTSSFYFKGKNESLKTIGETLGVAHILEGSVRKQGEKVRITAQLIQTEDGFHLWSETYDGDLTDVFELQERIARAITANLELILQGDQRTRLVPVATANPEAYALYLQATAVFNRRDGARFGDAISKLDEALRLDPKFARAHARLAALSALAPAFTQRDFETSLATAEREARMAIALDGELAEPHAVLGYAYWQQRRYREGRASLTRALALDADDVNANFWFATLQITTGYRKKGHELLDRVLAIDPMQPNALLWRGRGYAYDGDFASAERLLHRAADLGLVTAGLGLAVVAEARGRKPEAIKHLAAGARVFMNDFPAGAPEVLAEGIFGDAQARAKALALIDDYLATSPAVVAGIVPYAFIRLGEPRRMLALTRDRPTSNDAVFLGLVWSPYGRAVRALPEFRAFARHTGLTKLWDEHGVPDFCRKLDAEDYECE